EAASTSSHQTASDDDLTTAQNDYDGEVSELDKLLGCLEEFGPDGCDLPGFRPSSFKISAGNIHPAGFPHIPNPLGKIKDIFPHVCDPIRAIGALEHSYFLVGGGLSTASGISVSVSAEL